MKAYWLFGMALAALFTAFAAEAGTTSSSYTTVDAGVTNDVQVAPDVPAIVPRMKTEAEHENETENETESESEHEMETESETEHEGASRLDNARRPSMIDLDGGHDH